jgi:23S rRNA (adenine2503-C2)-methyltransferase
MEKPALAGISLSEIEKILSPLPRFRAFQIYKWIIRGVSGFEQMTDIPVSMRQELQNRFVLYSSKIDSCHADKGTKKIIVTLNDGLKIEAVLLSDNKQRYTACLSTQAGCPVGCVFCKTGSLKFSRNLYSSEIIEQFFHLCMLKNIKPPNTIQDSQNTTELQCGAAEKDNSYRLLDNIVIMGMGEPLFNMTNLREAVSIFTDSAGINFSRRRITVSTCGICDSMFDIAENGPFIRLALSLTTADENLRQKLIPASKTNPLKKIKEALILFQQNGGGRITLEIPLLGQINTRDKDALLIAEFAKGINSAVNIIPWNPVAGLEFEGKPLIEPEKKEIDAFIKKLEECGLKVIKRLGKGRRVSGACGQLGA